MFQNIINKSFSLSFNPATGEVWALIPDSGAHQVTKT